MIGALGRRASVELTRDRRFEARIRRLAVVSAVALGLIWALAVVTLEAPMIVDMALAASWLLMPLILVVSLRAPRLRYALVAPASLVTLALLAVCVGRLPGEPAAAFGWVLMALGVAIGGGLGMWLWYRLLPVPARLDDPFSGARWVLVAAHVGLVVAGFALATLAL